MNDKTIDITEISKKIINLLEYLEQNCIHLAEINCKLITSDQKNQCVIKKNLNSIAVVLNRVFEIKEEFEDNKINKNVTAHNSFSMYDDVNLLKTLKHLENITAEILEETYYINQNCKIIK